MSFTFRKTGNPVALPAPEREYARVSGEARVTETTSSPMIALAKIFYEKFRSCLFPPASKQSMVYAKVIEDLADGLVDDIIDGFGLVVKRGHRIGNKISRSDVPELKNVLEEILKEIEF